MSGKESKFVKGNVKFCKANAPEICGDTCC
jgi:hypothetical protein